MLKTFVRTLSFKAAPRITTKGTFLSLCYKKPDWKYLVQDNTNGGKYHQFHNEDHDKEFTNRGVKEFNKSFFEENIEEA